MCLKKTSSAIFTLFIVLTMFSQQKTKNILFLAVDDLNDHLGYFAEEKANNLKLIYDSPVIREQVAARITPNFDRLAKQSVKFMRAYTPSPLCNPSRTAILTGLRPHRTGIYSNKTNFRDIPELKDRTTLPQHFKNNDFYTVGLGKIFHTATNAKKEYPDEKNSWDLWINRPVGADGEKVKIDVPERPWIGALDVADSETADWQNSNFIGELLKNKKASITDIKGNKKTAVLPKNKPFFMACGIFRPHIPFYAPEAYYNRFPIEEMSINQNTINMMLADMEDVPDAGKKMSGLDHGVIKIIFDLMEAEKVKGGKVTGLQELAQAYLASVSYADACLGKILDGLEDSDYANDTMVVLWSDHGWHTATKYTFDKLTLWEPATRVVLLVKDPDNTSNAGESCYETVSTMDLYPTLIKKFNLPNVEGIDGNDISSVIQNPRNVWDKPAVSTFGRDNHCLRTKEWKYIRYKDGSKELYNMVADPWEYTNLADNILFSDLMFDLEKEMIKILNQNPVFKGLGHPLNKNSYKKW